MKKYIRAIICVVYSNIKFSLIKLFHFKSFNFSLIHLISPFTEVEVGSQAYLYLGKMVKMRSGSKIRVRKHAKLWIGKNTSLNHGCIFTAHQSIIIGENVQFGPNVLIYDHDHDFRKKNGLENLEYKTSPVNIGDNVWIGANSIILRGSEIGDNCVIAAGSIIKGKIGENQILIQKRNTEVKHYKDVENE